MNNEYQGSPPVNQDVNHQNTEIPPVNSGYSQAYPPQAPYLPVQMQPKRYSTSLHPGIIVLITVLCCAVITVITAIIVASVAYSYGYKSAYDIGFDEGYDGGYNDSGYYYGHDDDWIPETGTVFVEPPESLAPLEITDCNHDYFFRLIDNKNQTVMTFFIRQGDSYEFFAPLGNYKLKYAYGEYGEEWENEYELFGDDTRFALIDDEFNFTEDDENYNGFTISMEDYDIDSFYAEEITESQFWN